MGGSHKSVTGSGNTTSCGTVIFMTGAGEPTETTTKVPVYVDLVNCVFYFCQTDGTWKSGGGSGEPVVVPIFEIDCIDDAGISSSGTTPINPPTPTVEGSTWFEQFPDGHAIWKLIGGTWTKICSHSYITGPIVSPGK